MVTLHFFIMDTSSWGVYVQWIVGHILEFIYMGYWSAIDFCSGMLNQLQNWIMRELVLLWVPMVPTLNSYAMMT